jgi:hypothetical protein
MLRDKPTFECEWKIAKVLRPLAQGPLTRNQAKAATGLARRATLDGVTPRQSIPEGPEWVVSLSLRLLARSEILNKK